MKLTFMSLLGVIVINALILYYEFQGRGVGWKLYMGLAALTLLAALSLPLTLMLLIPITGYNLLVNTKRLQAEMFNEGGNNQNG